MANPKRGMVDILLDGETHQMRFTFNAIAELEAHFGEEDAKTKLADLFDKAENWSANDYTTVFVVGLKRGSIPDATVESVGDMLVFADFGYYAERLHEALNAANVGSLSVPKNPTQAAKPKATPATPAGSISTN